MMDLDELREKAEVIAALEKKEEVCWINPYKTKTSEALKNIHLTMADVKDAEERLKRFAPFIQKEFPETEATGGLIESPLTEIPRMRETLNSEWDAGLEGRLFLKRDSDLAVAGSVKARGGIYEILKYAEELARREGMLREGEDYEQFSDPAMKAFFSRYSIHVGSTGNLGLSIGIISACVGFQVYVHMSKDAKQWKKDLLREKGAHVIEYEGDYGKAVAKGRMEAESNPMSYFVDDERNKNSKGIYMADAYFNKYDDINLGFLLKYNKGIVEINPAIEGEAIEGRMYEIVENCGDIYEEMEKFINEFVI